ncbi:MAG TPA: MlaD family protein [Chitinophagaceae bacterium]|nr:MlaD family protein [Chitinophagaceae bacterium]
MKISNETKVGVLTICALTLLILGFNYLKGKDIFKKSEKIYAVFNDLGSLSKSNEVKINGYVIGSVIGLDITDKDMTGIVATINLTQNVNIPKDSKALISTPLVGASFITIEKGKSAEFLKSGDTLTTKVDVGILDDVKAQLTPTLTKVRNTLDTLNTVFAGINQVLKSENQENLKQAIANFNRASNALNGLLDNQTGALAKTFNNTSDLTEALKKNTGKIDSTINNLKVASDKFAKINIQPTIDSLNSAITEIKTIAAKINSSEGTMGALVNDKTLYNKLNDFILSTEILIDDLRAHPKRYVNLSIFGKKDKGGYLTSPLPKDTVPSGNK